MSNIVLVTGGFDPVHSGHINYIRDAKSRGDLLVVGLQSDEWLIAKKKTYFMPFEERKKVLEAIKYVDKVISFDDSDGTAYNAILTVKNMYKEHRIFFANGGDRAIDNAPETESNIPGIEYIWGVGGNKSNSSSSILRAYVEKTNDRI